MNCLVLDQPSRSEYELYLEDGGELHYLATCREASAALLIQQAVNSLPPVGDTNASDQNNLLHPKDAVPVQYKHKHYCVVCINGLTHLEEIHVCVCGVTRGYDANWPDV